MLIRRAEDASIEPLFLSLRAVSRNRSRVGRLIMDESCRGSRADDSDFKAENLLPFYATERKYLQMQARFNCSGESAISQVLRKLLYDYIAPRA